MSSSSDSSYVQTAVLPREVAEIISLGSMISSEVMFPSGKLSSRGCDHASARHGISASGRQFQGSNTQLKVRLHFGTWLSIFGSEVRGIDSIVPAG